MAKVQNTRAEAALHCQAEWMGDSKSSVSTGDFALLRSVGLLPLVPVQGVIVGLVPPLELVDDQPTAGYAARRQETLTKFTELALQRATADARRRGAQGLLGVEIEVTAMPQLTPTGMIQETAIAVRARGVPVRARSGTAPRFLRAATTCRDTAVLMRAGWIPIDCLIGIAVRTRNPRVARADASSLGSPLNAELPATTALVTTTRQVARTTIERRARELSADGVLITRIDSRQGAKLHAAEAMLLGSAIVRYRHGALSAPLTLRLR